MRRLGLLLLFILITSSCAPKPKPFCGKTKKACKKLGGECVRKGGTCDPGVMIPGKKYCQKFKKCDCCAPPPDCSVGTLAPCEALDGKCIGIDEECDGRVIINKLFCKSSDSCKCCFPGCDCDPDMCKTENGVEGKCSRTLIENSKNVGPMQCKDGCDCWIPDHTNICIPNECKTNNGVEGRCSRGPIPDHVVAGVFQCKHPCRCWIPDPNICIPAFCKTEDGVEGNCSRDPIENFMNAGQMQCKEGCNCWIPECRSIGDRCQRKGSFCIDPKEKCPVGFDETSDCFKPVLENGVWVKSQICKCCKPHQVDCENKYDCGDKLDYCVDKNSDDCPNKGYAILSNACFKTSPQYPEYTLRDSSEFVSLNISIPYSDCDCCKSLECRSIQDRCTGKGEFCTDPETTKSCPIGYIGTYDCYKPVIIEGVWVQSKKCLCCKPHKIDCGPVCHFANLTTCVCMLPGKPCEDPHCYYDGDLCGPDSCTCCDESSHTRCKSKHDECTAPDDYCVDKESAKCPKGFVKVSDTCHKSLSSQISVNCDCCKSLGCRPTRNQCSGKRDFCIDHTANCPTFYKASPGCHKVSASGKWIPCKCCKPLFIEWVEQKFWEPTTTPQGECGGKDCEQGHCYYPHDRAPIPSCPRGSTALPCDCFAIGEICCSNILT